MAIQSLERIPYTCPTVEAIVEEAKVQIMQQVINACEQAETSIKSEVTYKFRDALEDAVTEIEELEDKIEEMQEDIDSLKLEKEELEEEIKQLKERLSGLLSPMHEIPFYAK